MKKIKKAIKKYKVELYYWFISLIALGFFGSLLATEGFNWIIFFGIVLASQMIGAESALIAYKHTKRNEAAEILKDKFEVYTIDDDEGNIYYCLDLNSKNCYIKITKEEYYKLCEFQGKTDYE